MASALCRRITCRRLPSLRRIAIPTIRSILANTASIPEANTLSLRVHRIHISSMSQQAGAMSPAAAAAAAVPANSQGGSRRRGGGGSGGEGGRAAGIAIFSTLVAVTMGLGSWQAMRYSWKVDLVDSRTERMAHDPVDLPTGSKGVAIAEAMDILDKAKAWNDGGATSPECAALLSAEGMEALAEFEGRRVRVTGVFDHTKEILVGPRGAPPGLKAPSGSGSMATSPMGDFVLTPLKVKCGPTVLFNRGWAPRAGGTDFDRPTGEVTVVGVLKAAEQRGKFSPENDRPESRRLLWPEKESLLKAAGLSDVPMILMEAVADDDMDGRSGVPTAKQREHFCEFYVMPETHLMYAGTWFSLAAAASVLTWIRFRRKPPILPKRV